MVRDRAVRGALRRARGARAAALGAAPSRSARIGRWVAQGRGGAAACAPGSPCSGARAWARPRSSRSSAPGPCSGWPATSCSSRSGSSTAPTWAPPRRSCSRSTSPRCCPSRRRTSASSRRRAWPCSAARTGSTPRRRSATGSSSRRSRSPPPWSWARPRWSRRACRGARCACGRCTPRRSRCRLRRRYGPRRRGLENFAQVSGGGCVGASMPRFAALLIVLALPALLPAVAQAAGVRRSSANMRHVKNLPYQARNGGTPNYGTDIEFADDRRPAATRSQARTATASRSSTSRRRATPRSSPSTTAASPRATSR